MDEFLEADPRILRAVAHPIRSALVYELYARGEATATTLAHAIGRPVNSVSFHLRQLHRYGVIEEVTGRGGDGRARWWRPAGERGLRLDEASLREQPGGSGAHDVGMRYFEGRWHALVERLFRGREAGTTGVWQSNDVPMLLTDEEAMQMQSEMSFLLEQWMRRGRESAATNVDKRDPESERRTYLVLSVVMPHPVDLIKG